MCVHMKMEMYIYLCAYASEYVCTCMYVYYVCCVSIFVFFSLFYSLCVSPSTSPPLLASFQQNVSSLSAWSCSMFFFLIKWSNNQIIGIRILSLLSSNISV